MLHSMTIRLIYVDQLETLYLCYEGQMSIWGHLGLLGSKGHFHQKCYNSSILHSMTTRLIHVHQPETLYLCYGVKCQSEVNWGHRAQNIIFYTKRFNPSNLQCILI